MITAFFAIFLSLVHAAVPLQPVTATASASSLTLSAAAVTLPVICYHRFGEEDDFDELKISGRRFAAELAWLKKAGYQSISLQQARDFFNGKIAGMPAHPIILSMDDGYRSTWKTAGPILKRYGFKAVYFLISSQVGAGKNFLTWADVRELVDEGHEVGSHSVRHSNLAKPGKSEGPQAYQKRLAMELNDSKKALEGKLGFAVNSLAYPLGAYNPYVEAAARQAGYDLIFTVTASVNVAGDSPLRVHRFIIMSHPSLESFKKKVTEQRLQAGIEGVTEGGGIYAKELPRQIVLHMPAALDPEKAPRVELQGNSMDLTAGGTPGTWSLTLPKKMKPAFYYLRIEADKGRQTRRDSYLFQVYQNQWIKWFEPIKETQDDPVKH